MSDEIKLAVRYLAIAVTAGTIAYVVSVSIARFLILQLPESDGSSVNERS